MSGKPYLVSKCDEAVGHTWDVLRREDRVCVAQGFQTRSAALDVGHRHFARTRRRWVMG